jgi:hypothetical protein
MGGVWPVPGLLQASGMGPDWCVRTRSSSRVLKASEVHPCGLFCLGPTLFSIKSFSVRPALCERRGKRSQGWFGSAALGGHIWVSSSNQSILQSLSRAARRAAHATFVRTTASLLSDRPAYASWMSAPTISACCFRRPAASSRPGLCCTGFGRGWGHTLPAAGCPPGDEIDRRGRLAASAVPI